MKNLKTFLLVVVALVFCVNVTSAQSDKKADKQTVKAEKIVEKRDQKIEMMERKLESASPEEQAKIREKIEAYKAEKANNGNAYGKNKGDLEGKEFGLSRAAEAKAKEKVQQVYFEIEESEAIINRNAEKIKSASNRLEKAIQRNELNETEIAEKKAKIERAEKELHEAHMALKRKKETIIEYRVNVLNNKR